jgi:hypothetical protein
VSRLSDYADSLVEEGLSEAAGTFFGKRKRLEDEIAFFHEKCRELVQIGQTVVDRGQGLGFLLLQGERLADFYQALGVAWERGNPLDGSSQSEDVVPGSGLFARTRYWKSVYRTYAALFNALDVYTNGRHYDDPSRPGGKKRTVCLNTLTAWGAGINERVEALNRNNQPSQVLQFAKQFRVGEVEKENITGGGLVYNLDEDLSFARIDLSQCGFFTFPVLPSPEEVKKTIKAYALQVYREHRKMVEDLLQQIKRS